MEIYMQIQLQIKDIIKSNKLLNLTDLNPWCLNEGLATGEEFYIIEGDKKVIIDALMTLS